MPSAKRWLNPGSLKNRLLRALPAHDLERILPQLQVVDLTIRTVLIAPELDVESVYFIEAGIASMVSTLEDGARIEVGMVASKAWSACPSCSARAHPLGKAWCRLRAAPCGCPPLPFGRADRASVADGRAAALPRRRAVSDRPVRRLQRPSPVEQRLARWILTTLDRVGGESFL